MCSLLLNVFLFCKRTCCYIAAYVLWLLAGDVAIPGRSLLTAVDPGSSSLPCRCTAGESQRDGCSSSLCRLLGHFFFLTIKDLHPLGFVFLLSCCYLVLIVKMSPTWTGQDLACFCLRAADFPCVPCHSNQHLKRSSSRSMECYSGGAQCLVLDLITVREESVL